MTISRRALMLISLNYAIFFAYIGCLDNFIAAANRGIKGIVAVVIMVILPPLILNFLLITKTK